MRRLIINIFILLTLPIGADAQSGLARLWESDSLEIGRLSAENLAIVNSSTLENFFTKLQFLEENKQGRVHIVHVGDSHIQAGFSTSQARELLQERYGNGGYGFSFPYRLAGSHGPNTVKYSSTVPWHGVRNVFAKNNEPVGISGFGMWTEKKEFAVRLKVEDDVYKFNSLKLFRPYPGMEYSLAVHPEGIDFDTYQVEYKIHRIAGGETLSGIGRRYGVKVSEIKRANGLSSDMIRVGGQLKIPQRARMIERIDRGGFRKLESVDEGSYVRIYAPDALGELWVLPENTKTEYALNGFLLENDEAGVLFSGIGVNGARFSDYNRSALFFSQFRELDVDLLIISLGTNEALDELDMDKYRERMEEFIGKIRKIQPSVSILCTTPPPFRQRRGVGNQFSAHYSQLILELAAENDIAVWDLHHVMGGVEKLSENHRSGIMAKDFIHFTKIGYQYTAALLVEALMHSYEVGKQEMENSN